MNSDSYLTIVISIFIIIILLSKTQIRVQSQTHFVILLFIVFLFYTRNEKSAFMASVLYLIVYVQSCKKKEHFSSSGNLPNFSLTKTINPTDKISESILINNNLPSQITSWLTGDSFDTSTKEIHWRDLASNSHIYFTTSSNVKLNSSTKNNASGPRKWVSGDTTAQLTIPLSTSTNDSVTFVHLTRYSPRTSNRGKLWSSENGTHISGYNDNKITVTNTDGTEIVNSGGDKNGDIMNIRGSNWNLFIDQMDITKKIRTVLINGNDYIFQHSMQSIPNKIGLNINSGDKSDWDCAEIMIYPRILDANELQQINQYFNKKYSMKYPDKIEANKYNIYNHYTFNSIPDNDWNSPPQVGSTTQSGNKLLGITDSEYECVSLCDKNTTTCAAFSYHMEKGACYSVDEKNILNHTTPNKVVLSGTNRIREDIAQKAKEEAERKAREEAERQRLAAIAAALAESERQRQAAVEAERLRQQKLLLSQDRFIPIFNKDSNDAMGSDGVYKIDIRNGSTFPCYNISKSGYINGGAYGSLLDNNDTTGVDIEKYYDRTLPYTIVITLPVEKTFQGTFSMRLITPWSSKLPKRVALATYNSNAFLQNWWTSSSSQDNQHKLEEINLGDVGGGGNGPYDHSWDINFTRPFKHIALIVYSGWTQDGSAQGQAGAIWITSLNFMNSGSGPEYGSTDGTKKSFKCPPNRFISGYFGRSGGWMDQIQFMCSDGTYSEKYGGDGGGPNIGYSWSDLVFPTNGFQLTSAWPNGPLSRIGLLTSPDAGVIFDQGGQLSVNPGKINCPAGKRVTGVDVNSDHYVQKITLKCEK